LYRLLKKIKSVQGSETLTKGDEMLTTEQQTQIVNFMYPDGDEPKFTYSYSSEEFVFKIFKALVDECKKREFDIAFRNGWIVIEEEHNIPDYGPEEHFSELFDNESICLAYLKVMESK